jgi:hypothetical protein
VIPESRVGLHAPSEWDIVLSPELAPLFVLDAVSVSGSSASLLDHAGSDIIQLRLNGPPAHVRSARGDVHATRSVECSSPEKLEKETKDKS